MSKFMDMSLYNKQLDIKKNDIVLYKNLYSFVHDKDIHFHVIIFTCVVCDRNDIYVMKTCSQLLQLFIVYHANQWTSFNSLCGREWQHTSKWKTSYTTFTTSQHISLKIPGRFMDRHS